MIEIMFNCCICNYKTDNEENINYHYLWSHNQWRGNCESPNKINIKTEADNIVKDITNIINTINYKRKSVANRIVFNSKEGFFIDYHNYDNHDFFRKIFGLLKRLDQLNWAKPTILYTTKSKNLLNIYNDYKYNIDVDYSYTKKNVIRQRDFEDKMQKEEDLIKKLTKEVDEELMREKQKQ
jgi:hypothetical protein